ncbi:MAG: hypothetical protein IKP68_03005 [Clostridia bacterium]|nr:hypothetical protein [Clostridia bacterium]
MWWIIPAVIAAAAIVALNIPVRLHIVVGDDVSVEWRVLFMRKPLYPAPPKKKKKKKAAKKEQTKKAAPKKREITAHDVIDMLRSAAEVLGELLSKLRRRMKILLIKLNVKVGTDEAAKTAVIYGAAANACDELLEIMRRYTKFREKSGAVSVTADFTSEKTDFAAELELSASVIGIFGVLLPTVNKLMSKK